MLPEYAGRGREPNETDMSESATDYRKYLDPRTLAQVGSLDLRAG